MRVTPRRPVILPKDAPWPLTPLSGEDADENDCMAYFVSLRWPGGVRCPRCNSERVAKLARPWRWQCKRCSRNGYRFSPLVGTIFEASKCPLTTWFSVIYLMCACKEGLSIRQVQRLISGRSPKTAWRLCRRIRAAMENEDSRKRPGVAGADRITAC